MGKEPRIETCKLCGRILRPDISVVRAFNPCPDCGAAAARDRLERRDRDALRAEFGYFPDVEWREFVQDAGLTVHKKWQGYTAELLGAVLGRFSECFIPEEGVEVYRAIDIVGDIGDSRVLLQPSIAYPFVCIPDPEDPDLMIQLCRIRAQYKDSPLYSEMRAFPQGVRCVAIHGLEYKHTTVDKERAMNSLELLHVQQKKLGRRTGSRFYSEADFVKRVPAAYQAFYERTGRHPQDFELAFELDISRATLYRSISQYSLSFDKIRALAIK